MALIEGGAIEGNGMLWLAPNEMSWRRQLAVNGEYSHQQVLVGGARRVLPFLAVDAAEMGFDRAAERGDCEGEGRREEARCGMDYVGGLCQERVSEGGLASPQVSEGDVIIPPCTPDVALEHGWLSPPQIMSPPPAKLRRRASMADVSYHQKATCPSPNACPILELHVPTLSASQLSAQRTVVMCPNKGATWHLGRERGLLKRPRSEEEVGCPDRAAFTALPPPTPYLRGQADGQCCPPRQQADQVSNADISCPNRDCDWTGQREFLTCHLEEVCTSALVPCAFAASGCPALVPRGKMAGHLTEEMGNHLMLVARDNTELRGRLRALGDAQTTLHTRVDNLETLAIIEHPEDTADDATSICSSA